MVPPLIDVAIVIEQSPVSGQGIAFMGYSSDRL